MSNLHVRRLRVQVLLWTILPGIIFLVAFSLTGIGSHEESMRRLVAEENLKLVGAVSTAISTRLEHYTAHLELMAAAPAAYPTLKEVEVWRFASDQPGSQSLPAWVQTAVTAAPAGTPSAQGTRITFDADSGRVVWTVPLRGQNAGWLVGSVPVTAFGLDKLMAMSHPNSVTTFVLTNNSDQIIYGKGQAPAAELVGAWPGVGPALGGEKGVLVDTSNGQEDIIAFASVAGAPWALIIREPLDALTAPLFHYSSLLPLILTAAVILSFFTLFFGLRYIAQPIELLASQANRIGQGEFAAASQPVGGLDEIEDLRGSIDLMAQRIQANQAALQAYAHAVTSVQEVERSRLARELHDETVQALIALDHKAQMVQRSFDRHPERCREQMADLRHMIAGAIQEVQRISQALRPPYLDDLGLAPAVEILAHDAGAELRVAGVARRLGADKELVLYRIAQESLTNVRRHAHAQTIRVALHFGLTGVTLAIRDDGVGFVMPDMLTVLTGTGHFGLMGMRERAELIGGQFHIATTPGAGTAAIVQVAYDEHLQLKTEEWQVSNLAAWLIG